MFGWGCVGFRQIVALNRFFAFFQIELDLLRTLPNNKHYDSPNADGIPKLRRVLLAYSVHNPEVEYCQVRHMIIYSFRKFNNLKLLRRPLRFSRFTDFPESGRKKAIKETLKIGKTQCLKIISKSLIFLKIANQN